MIKGRIAFSLIDRVLFSLYCKADNTLCDFRQDNVSFLFLKREKLASDWTGIACMLSWRRHPVHTARFRLAVQSLVPNNRLGVIPRLSGTVLKTFRVQILNRLGPSLISRFWVTVMGQANLPRK
jgi:hypothetical protein